jgi:hypothetical protein
VLMLLMLLYRPTPDKLDIPFPHSYSQDLLHDRLDVPVDQSRIEMGRNLSRSAISNDRCSLPVLGRSLQVPGTDDEAPASNTPTFALCFTLLASSSALISCSSVPCLFTATDQCVSYQTRDSPTHTIPADLL